MSTSTLEAEPGTPEELLLEYRSTGDRNAFNKLLHRFEDELYGYLRHYLGNADDAEDVHQLTWLQIHQKCEKFTPGRKVRPWLYTVATHQAIDYQRRNRRHQMVSLDRRVGGSQGDECNIEAGALVELLDGSGKESFEKLLESESNESVRAAVNKLPEPIRQVVVLIYFQGLKYREAAEVLDIPVGTVKSRLHAGIAKLKVKLEKQDIVSEATEETSEKAKKALAA